MTKKMKYPVEAFALAAVLFSSGMKEAMIVGIGLIFGDVLQYVLRDFSPRKYLQTFRAVCGVVTCGVIYYMHILVGITPAIRQVIGFMMLGILLIKHQAFTDETTDDNESIDYKAIIDYNAVLYADSIAYGIFVLFAIVREYLTGAKIFGYELQKFAFVSSAFGKTMFALVGAGIMIAVLNRILKTACERDAALWVCIPVLLLEAPFVWNQATEWIGTGIGIVFTLVVYITLRKKLCFSDIAKHMEGIPTELAMLGIIYMILEIL